MRVTVQNTLTTRQSVAYEGTAGFTIGRAETCQVRLPSMFVSSVHARVEPDADGWCIELPEGVSPIQLNGSVLEPGQRAPLGPATQARLNEFVLILEDVGPEPGADLEQQLTDLQASLHASVLGHLDLRRRPLSALEPDVERLGQLNDIADAVIFGEFESRIFGPPLHEALLRRALRRRLAERLLYERQPNPLFDRFGHNPALEDEADRIVRLLAERLGLDMDRPEPALAEARIDEAFDEHVPEAVASALENVRTYLIVRELKRLLFDTIFGFGPLQDLLEAQNVSEIMVVHPRLIFIERNGRVVRSDQAFFSDEGALTVIERIVAPLGRRIDRSQPLIDARLPDGSRVNAVIPPLAIKGPCLTIRKFPRNEVTVDHLVRWRALTEPTVALLRACVRGRLNIIVAGGTGSGKTTMLNALSAMIGPQERLVTIEDSAELRLQQEHVVTLETRPANAEGVGAYTIRDLVRNALRMRPDRIIVGECRGAEAIDMLQAMNTGHEGSMTTLHANSAQDVVARLETMVLLGADIPLLAVRRQIADAVDLIVFVERLSNGRRMVSQVAEVAGLRPDNDQMDVRPLMTRRGNDDEAGLELTGTMPTFLDRLVERGLIDLAAWFAREQEVA